MQGFAAGDTPGPFALDGGVETDLEQNVEVAVGGFEDLPEEAIDLVSGDRVGGDAADEIDVADVVEGVRDAVDAPVTFEQVFVHLLEVLVGTPAHEGLHPQPVLLGGEQHRGLELLLTGQLEDEVCGLRTSGTLCAVADLAFSERRLDDLGDFAVSHADFPFPSLAIQAPTRVRRRSQLRRIRWPMPSAIPRVPLEPRCSLSTACLDDSSELIARP